MQWNFLRVSDSSASLELLVRCVAIKCVALRWWMQITFTDLCGILELISEFHRAESWVADSHSHAQKLPVSYWDETGISLLNHYCLRDAPIGLTANNCYFLHTHCIYVFCIYLRTNSDLCHLQHKLIGFYTRDEKCLQRGTDWVFK
jgi:hypothetical protein